ncbi:hypothetical protein CVT26_013148 [Gymnopilus dilepis]|uniref:Uncharacterized protein n=1 Tax=Gymnopilus dilepis TaxID=231916 RepID=A0A409WUW0_9AGAR|nr:hypothetical protein CVT26_013148 [Gymnopilus dilepis]
MSSQSHLPRVEEQIGGGSTQSFQPAATDAATARLSFCSPGAKSGKGMMLPLNAAYLAHHINMVTNIYRTSLALKSESEVLGPPPRHPMTIVADAPPLRLTSGA